MLCSESRHAVAPATLERKKCSYYPLHPPATPALPASFGRGRGVSLFPTFLLTNRGEGFGSPRFGTGIGKSTFAGSSDFGDSARVLQTEGKEGYDANRQNSNRR